MFVTLAEATEIINSGKVLHIAADDSLLAQLPKGKWIGGTTPYFITYDGGLFSKEKLYVYEIDYASDVKITTYDEQNIFNIVEDCFDNGLTMLIMPYGSEVATKYGKMAPEVEKILMHPTVGWISGFDLDARTSAKVYDGTTGEAYTDKAVVMYLELEEGKSAMINMINILDYDKEGPVIKFFENELGVEKCSIDGKETNLADYIRDNNIDTRMPLVTDHNGSYFNTSIREVVDGRVNFYAPVFKNLEYRFAAKVEDYAEEFRRRINATGNKNPVVSFNCVLNYQYGNLNGRKISPYVGPVTFGEIAYQLLNQTLVYCEIVG